MIKTLYPVFRHWSEKGSVFIISDTHFEDADCKLMDPNWITPEEQVEILKKHVHKNDTLIHLGDVGNPEWMKEIKAYKVLITGNHDRGVQIYEPFFDEIYNGPLFIADKILLSHEPITIEFAMNIHGHDHNREWKSDGVHLNCACNVIGYRPVNLGSVIKDGHLKNIPSIHRLTIDHAKEKKQKKTKPILGHPRYNYGDMVTFSYPTKENQNAVLEGSIEIIDAFGTFEQNKEPSYDIYIKSKNTLYKHVRESYVIEKTREAKEEERL